MSPTIRHPNSTMSTSFIRSVVNGMATAHGRGRTRSVPSYSPLGICLSWSSTRTTVNVLCDVLPPRATRHARPSSSMLRNRERSMARVDTTPTRLSVRIATMAATVLTFRTCLLCERIPPRVHPRRSGNASNVKVRAGAVPAQSKRWIRLMV
ncbi:hypothetical protein BC628DRAFT_1369212 [Trametes gibbosa]|nr:hypothetical protein BC628DRAFT_1369212 [Trametes gibbosa]